jgi:hypothetical protein
MEKFSRKIILMAFLFAFVVGCKEDEQIDPNETNDPNESNPIQNTQDEKISLSQVKLEWQMETPPDSIFISIIGQEKPYTFHKHPRFSCHANISDTILKISPIKRGNNNIAFGLDTIVVADTAGNKALLEIEVKSYIKPYFNVHKGTLNVSGDTAFTQNLTTTRFVRWDTDKKDIIMNLRESNHYLNFYLDGIDTSGSYTGATLNYSFPNVVSKSVNFSSIDTNQVTIIEKLTEDSLKLSFKLSAADNNNNFNGTVLLDGYFILVR